METETRYYNSSKNWWRYDPKYQVLELLEGSGHVLDVGCSYGDFGAAIKEKYKNISVEGVDFYEPALAEAKNVLDSVYKINLNDSEQIIQTLNKKYDAITFMDVLEHCIEPEQVLATFKKILTPNGKIFISIPNVANIRTRFHLLRGQWDYQDYGVLDRTHLRFYTEKTALNMAKGVFKNSKIVGHTPISERIPFMANLMPGMFALHIILECPNDISVH